MARGGGGVGDGRRVGARIGGGTRLVAPAMIVGRASRGRAGAAARPPRRASPRAGGHPRGRKKNKRENQKRGPNLTGPGPRTGRVLTRPRRSSRSGRCLWPDAPPACRTRTFRWTTSVPTRSHALAQPTRELKSKREPATFRAARLAAQISRSPTGPSRAFLLRCERFRRPSSCAPVCERMRDVRGGARANNRGRPGRITPQSRGVPTRGVSNQ